MEDYRYLKPDEDMSLEEYGGFLDARYTQLQGVARLYGRMAEVSDAGDGARHRFVDHWEKYVDAASTVHRVRRELEEYGKLPDGYADTVAETGQENVGYESGPDA